MGKRLDKIKNWFVKLDKEKLTESNKTNGFLIVAIVSGLTYLLINWLDQFNLSIWEVFAISVIIGGITFWVTRQVQIWIGLPSKETIDKSQISTKQVVEEAKESAPDTTT